MKSAAKSDTIYTVVTQYKMKEQVLSMGKDIEKKLSEKEQREAVEKALEFLGVVVETGSKEFIASINPVKMMRFLKSAEIIEEASRRCGATMTKKIDPVTYSGTIVVCGKSLEFLGTEEIVQALGNSSNFNVYVNPKGVPQIDLVFYEIMGKM